MSDAPKALPADKPADSLELGLRIGGLLHHPGVVPVYGIGLQNGERLLFAMKLVKGDTLVELLGRRK